MCVHVFLKFLGGNLIEVLSTDYPHCLAAWIVSPVHPTAYKPEKFEARNPKSKKLKLSTLRKKQTRNPNLWCMRAWNFRAPVLENPEQPPGIFCVYVPVLSPLKKGLRFPAGFLNTKLKSTKALSQRFRSRSCGSDIHDSFEALTPRPGPHAQAIAAEHINHQTLNR